MLLLRWLYTPNPPPPFAENPPQLKAAAFPAAEQQFASNVLPQLVSVFSNAGGIQSDVVSTTTVVAHNMQWAAQRPSVSPPWIGEGFPIKTTPSLSATQQQFAGIVVPAAFQSRLFSENPQQFAKVFPAALQRPSVEMPLPRLSTTGTPSNFGYSESPLQFGKLYPVPLQPFASSFTPAGTIVSITPQGGYTDQPPQFAKSFNAALQRNEFVFVTPRQPYVFAEPPQQFAKPFSAALQRPADYAVQNFVTAAATTPLVAQLSPELFARPLAAGMQLFSSFGAIPSLVSILSNVGGIESDVIFQTLVIAHSMHYPVQSAVATATPSAFGYSESPVQFGRPFPAAEQRFPDFVPQGTVVSTTPQGGYADLWWQFAKPILRPDFSGLVVPAAFQPRVFGENPPQQFAKPFAASLQRNEFVFVTPRQPYVFTEPPLQFAKAFLAALQRNEFAAQNFAATATPSAFGYSESPAQFAKPFAATLQRNPDYAVQSFVATTTPTAFSSSENPPQFVRLFAPILQQPAGFIFVPPMVWAGDGLRDDAVIQYAVVIADTMDYAVQTFVTGATPSAFGYSESPPRFSKPFPAHQQQFGSFQPIGTITFKSKGGEWIIRARRRHKR